MFLYGEHSLEVGGEGWGGGRQGGLLDTGGREGGMVVALERGEGGGSGALEGGGRNEAAGQRDSPTHRQSVTGAFVRRRRCTSREALAALDSRERAPSCPENFHPPLEQ